MGRSDPRVDLTGHRFGDRVVVRYVGGSAWLTRCACGREIKAETWDLRHRGTFVCKHLTQAHGLNMAPVERFARLVKSDGPVPAHRPDLGPCHIWLGKLKRGKWNYGYFSLERTWVFAHRVAFFFAHGRWPEPLCLHHCDNPQCVRPEHLFEGTSADNTRDMYEKCRAGSRLQIPDVREVRSALERGEPRRAIAKRFGVAISTIAMISLGENWKGVA